MNKTDLLLELQRLRRRLAGSEKIDTLRHLIEDTTALKGIAPDSVLETIGDFTDRVNDKIERLKNKAPPA